MTQLFEDPDRFVVGTLGQPGERIFVIQARQRDQLVSLIVEKLQAKALAERLQTMLDGVATLGEVRVPKPPEVPHDRAALDSPLKPAFRVDEIRLVWDRGAARIVIEFLGVEAETVSVHLSISQAQEFILRAETEVASGRPVCPFCSQPLDPGGHLCPRSNGFRATLAR